MNFFKTIFQEYHQSVKQFGCRSHFVGPDLGPNCLQRLSADDKSLQRNTIKMSNSLDSDQARHFVRPDLGPNCLQKLSADDKSRH